MSDESHRLVRERIAEMVRTGPPFHIGETEMARPLDPRDSFLEKAALAKVITPEPKCWGLEGDVLRFLADTLTTSSKTLETGAGLSTITFALTGAAHTCVTPSRFEIDAIRHYAEQHGVDLARVRFVCARSESWLPAQPLGSLDLVLLDGKHAFPWPMIDWFYTVGSLRQRGILVLDDTDLFSVKIMRDFMAEDHAWKLCEELGKTAVFQKIGDNDQIFDVAWHLQPYLMNRQPRRALLSRLRTAAHAGVRAWLGTKVPNDKSVPHATHED